MVVVIVVVMVFSSGGYGSNGDDAGFLDVGGGDIANGG